MEISFGDLLLGVGGLLAGIGAFVAFIKVAQAIDSWSPPIDGKD